MQLQKQILKEVPNKFRLPSATMKVRLLPKSDSHKQLAPKNSFPSLIPTEQKAFEKANFEPI